MLAGFPDILGIADLYLHHCCGPVLTENRKCCGNRKAQPRRYQLGNGGGTSANAVCRVSAVAVSLSCPVLPLPFPSSHRSSSFLLCLWEHIQLVQGWLDGDGAALSSQCSSPLSCVVLYWTPRRSCPHISRSSSSSFQGYAVAGRSWF